MTLRVPVGLFIEFWNHALNSAWLEMTGVAAALASAGTAAGAAAGAGLAVASPPPLTAPLPLSTTGAACSLSSFTLSVMVFQETTLSVSG